MENYAWSKTANRSVIGSMNDFALLGGLHRHAGESEDLVALSASIAHTPCSPLYESHVSPDEEVRARVCQILCVSGRDGVHRMWSAIRSP